jgi:hypothetical protein
MTTTTPASIHTQMGTLKVGTIKHLTLNGHFNGRTARLTYTCCIFLFIQQIYVLNILNMLHTLRFSVLKIPFIS